MSEIPAGAMRFNSDSQKLEYWNGSAWFQVHTATPNLAQSGDRQPGARGFLLLEEIRLLPTNDNSIILILASAGRCSFDFGDLTGSKSWWLRIIKH